MASHVKLPSGNFQCISRYTNPLTGKRTKITLTYSGSTRKAQRNAERELEDKIDRILEEYEYAQPDRILRFSQLVEKWLEHWRVGVNERTVEREILVIRRVNELIDGDVLVESITPLLLEKLLTDYQKKYDSSYSTMIHIKSTLNKIFRYAVKHRILVYSPMSVVELNLPREKKMEPKIRRKLKYLEPHELNAFLTEVKKSVNPVYYHLTLFLVNTGLRIGEAGALTVDDVDFENRRITVTKNLIQIGKGKFEYGPPKTEESERVVGLSQVALKSLIVAMEKSKQLDRRYQIKPWKSYVQTDSIFRTLNGAPVTFKSYRTFIHRIQDDLRENCESKYGFKWVKNITPHSFRFINITYLKDSEGVDPKSIQSHVGHTDLRTTMNVYAQTSNKGTTRIVNALDHWLDKDNPLDFYPEVFCSEYSTRLNKILRENIDKDVIKFTLEDFKRALGIPPEYQTRHLKNNILQKMISDLSEEWQAFDIETIYGKMRKILGYKITYGNNLVLKGNL